MNNEDRDYDMIRRRMASYNDPPETPADEMWQTVRESWSTQAGKRRHARRVRVWGGAGLGVAAVLTLGIAIGRWTSPQTNPTGPAEVAQASSGESGQISTAYRLAAGEHFREAETLLVLFDSAGEPDDELTGLARDLLSTTRLLMDSRIGEDTEVRRMLLDLELLLIQISQLAGTQDSTERDLVREGLEGSSVLPRLRRLIPDAASTRGA